jgi:15-cis-phytoene synthase
MSGDINLTYDSSYQIMKKSKTNFAKSTIFLSPEKQDAINIIYSFCRHSDDIVDDEFSDLNTKKENLENWRTEFQNALENKSKIKILIDLKEVIDRYNIHHDIFWDLLKGMEMDLSQSRYKTFDDLHSYCFLAASTVGLMTIEVYGYKDKAIQEYAVNLGIALQLTNILRDVKSDAAIGRIYIPTDDLEQFGCTENDILESNYSKNFVELMKFECERAKSFYAKADNFLVKSEKGRMMSARIIEHIYFRILKKIEKSGYNVFEKRVRLSNLSKLLIAYGVFIKYKLMYT